MALITAAAATATWMYLDAKYSIRSDISQIRGGRSVQKYVEKLYNIHGEHDWSFYHVLHATYGLNDDTEALVFESRSWTYGQLRGEIGRLAETFRRMGITNRTVVAMFVNNSPEFMFAWWALYKLGAIPAPINTAITGEHIRHCLRISEAEFLVSTYELYGTVAGTLFSDDGGEGARSKSEDSIHPAVPLLKEMVLYDCDTYSATECETLAESVVLIRHNDLPPITPEMGDFPKASRPRVALGDTGQYLFTSGTTGLPKATTWPSGYSIVGTCPGRHPGMNDKYRRFYICLPMFHGTATFAALPNTLSSSGTIILARRFSRRQFWDDCRQSNANAVLYIGEMLRYLVQAPPDPKFPDEKKMHNVDLAFGLGLAPTVWRQFRERFGVPWIVEYYSASESTVSLVNSNFNDYGLGKVAHWGPLMRSKWFGQNSFFIVRTDIDTGEVIRSPDTGFCVRAAIGEIGESIVRIAPPVQRRHDYVGEGGVEATKKKVLNNVFEKGDEFFRLGDALMIDTDGFISFQDRLGDTYRSKGHNVSTTEVEGSFSKHPNVASVNVYGIPMNHHGYDGQLGCAAVTFRSDASGSELEIVRELEKWLLTSTGALPAYTVPRFLRVLVDTEGTTQIEG
ncbi:hypothetical protein VE00_09146 [Pseudogymnoascus sp. WSF 3629]|nr:hypothetical protein VE00_09146 [Pseudogymnoascus sp. WSF 3629]